VKRACFREIRGSGRPDRNWRGEDGVEVGFGDPGLRQVGSEAPGGEGNASGEEEKAIG
jgi:hypothetical protein